MRFLISFCGLDCWGKQRLRRRRHSNRRIRSLRRASPLAGTVLSICLSLVAAANAAEVDFERDVAPLLIRRCLECHGPSNPSGNLNLTTPATLLAGGDSGPALVAGNLAESLIHDRITQGEMPPARKGIPQPLPAAEVEILNSWIAAGAPWPGGRVLDLFERTTDLRGGRDWWSLQPIARPAVPRVPGAEHPIDAFIREKLMDSGLSPAPPGDRRTLVRRLYADVWGLPPTFDEIEAFAADEDSRAWERLVERLLMSPHFGERWARHWLDLVRFAETSGYERDQTKPYAWKYRDWVVTALHTDMPFDQFIIQQLAGDEIPERTDDSVIATGFLRLGTWNDEPNDPDDYTYDRLEDLVHATSSAFLGLTVKCARCHDHKFDPIPQVDYYRMAAAFWPGPVAARQRDLLGGPSEQELGAKEILGWTDLTTAPSPLHLLKGGDRHQPRQAVTPASLSFVPEQFAEFHDARDRTTQRRLQLARWIAGRENPLTPRVIVNRIWQHHFGEGLVRSPDNFGFTGDPPTHPELLDWLASELIDHGWSLKHIHRLILTSETYRQSADHPQDDSYSRRDALNRLWWRANRRRLDAESLHDALLSASGEIDLRIGGPSFKPTVSAEALEGLSRKASAWEASPAQEQRRRGLYTFMQRSLLPPLMTVFDLCDSTLPCGQRDSTVVPPQALTLLNNSFVHDRSLKLAADVIDGCPAEDDRIRSLWRAVLRRDPTDPERIASLAHVKHQLGRFQDADATKQPAPVSAVAQGPALWLDADHGVERDPDGRVMSWKDRIDDRRQAVQSEIERRPVVSEGAIGGHAALRFDGRRRFLELSSPLLKSADSTILAVVVDQGGPGHREILSNWSGRDGNSVQSLFLGLTAENRIRFSDDFSNAGAVTEQTKPFLLAAVNGPHGAAVYQNGRLLAERPQPLTNRRLDTPWVIGQQGNIDGEYWQGEIACLLVYDRPLSPEELSATTTHLLRHYGIPVPGTDPAPPDPELSAWASLAVVLMNTNEFLYVD